MSGPALRPEAPEDEAFLRALFAEEAVPALCEAGLDGCQAEQLAAIQHRARSEGYRAQFPEARFSIILHDGVPVGRLVEDEAAARIVDIAVLRARRRRGVARAVLAEAQARWRRAGQAGQASVLAGNAASLRLFEGLGFRAHPRADRPDIALVWAPAASGSPVPDRLRLPLVFDPVPLQRDLDALAASGWIAHFVTGNYTGDWSVIPLRGPAGATHPVAMAYSDPAAAAFADTPFLARCPAFAAVLAAFACPLQAVRLMRLGPGAVIREHRDHDLAFEQGSVRIHVPVVTNPGVDFRLNGRPVTMEPGSAWYLRLSDPHGVANRGAAARIHLVIDAGVNPWLADLFGRAQA